MTSLTSALSTERPVELYIHREQPVVITGTIPMMFSRERIVHNVLESVKRNPQDKVSAILIKKNAMGWTIVGQQMGVDAKDASPADSVEVGVLDVPAYLEKGFERIL